MRIALISSNDSEINILPALATFLQEQIINVEVDTFTERMNLDIIKRINELDDYDLIFVFVIYSSEDAKIRLLLEKLVELEVSKGINIIKAVERLEEEETEEEPLLEKWGELILEELFGKEEAS